MNLDAMAERFRADLNRTAGLGGAEVAAAAERLLLAVDPALRMTLLEALSQAAQEIAHALPGTQIGVRVEGREPVFVVEQPVAAAQPDASDKDDGDTIRITLRLPEALKARAETLAAKRGQSLNTWLVGAVRAAADGEYPPAGGRPGKRIRGWAR
jgi:hypothetical protein